MITLSLTVGCGVEWCIDKTHAFGVRGSGFDPTPKPIWNFNAVKLQNESYHLCWISKSQTLSTCVPQNKDYTALLPPFQSKLLEK
jgi:hypothetical protein